jgi:hypothetical protein
LGFVSPVVLAIGARIEKIGLRQQATCPFRGIDTSRFATLESLWKVINARTEEVNKKYQKSKSLRLLISTYVPQKIAASRARVDQVYSNAQESVLRVSNLRIAVGNARKQ